MQDGGGAAGSGAGFVAAECDGNSGADVARCGHICDTIASLVAGCWNESVGRGVAAAGCCHTACHPASCVGGCFPSLYAAAAAAAAGRGCCDERDVALVSGCAAVDADCAVQDDGGLALPQGTSQRCARQALLRNLSPQPGS